MAIERPHVAAAGSQKRQGDRPRVEAAPSSDYTLVAIPSKEQRLSDIKIRRAHAMPHDKARAAAEKMAKLLKKEFALDYEWAEDEKDVLVFERPGVNGELTVAPKHVEMEVKLGFLLKMMKPTIERHIHDHLDEIFAEHEKAKPKKA